VKRKSSCGWIGTGFAILMFLILSVLITSMGGKIILNSNRSGDAARQKQAYWNSRVGYAISNQASIKGHGSVSFSGGKVIFDDICVVGQSSDVVSGGALITLQSNDFNNNATLSSIHIKDSGGCTGSNQSPQLNWSGVPVDAQKLVIIVSDADASNYTHWAVYNIAPTTTTINRNTTVLSGATFLKSYEGPCPTASDGINHRYIFKIYAINGTISLNTGDGLAELKAAMQGKVLACGQLLGRFQRS